MNIGDLFISPVKFLLMGVFATVDIVLPVKKPRQFMAGALVSASTGVMESLLGKLSSMLEKEYAKKKTVEKDVLFLRNELSSMNTVMQKYAMLSEPHLQVKAWMKEVRELAYDIEDTIDAFMARSEKSNEPTGIRGFIINNILKLRELLSSCTISQEIEKLKNQVLEVNDRRKRYKLDVSVSMGTGCESIDPRLPAFYSGETLRCPLLAVFYSK
uniref:Disease resistance protein RPM1, putative n=2 Tax=Oryza sativa subsp. japonica TaxID=39947 RepID=Q53LZ4_ORYSJ|nr:Similar to RPM1 like protein [Oryza sativa Japonica Group]ABA92583.1 disease resistance protein RPM1, putative [Oryza sativa Japonica Group]